MTSYAKALWEKPAKEAISTEKWIRKRRESHKMRIINSITDSTKDPIFFLSNIVLIAIILIGLIAITIISKRDCKDNNKKWTIGEWIKANPLALSITFVMILIFVYNVNQIVKEENLKEIHANELSLLETQIPAAELEKVNTGMIEIDTGNQEATMIQCDMNEKIRKYIELKGFRIKSSYNDGKNNESKRFVITKEE